MIAEEKFFRFHVGKIHGKEQTKMQTSRLNSMQVIWKKTGRIKPAPLPHYIGHRLYDVYDSYSQAKSYAYDYCVDILREDIGIENVISYGITSKNTFQFTFEAVFKYEDLRYVLVVTKSCDKVYILDNDSDELYKRLDEIAERAKNVH